MSNQPITQISVCKPKPQNDPVYSTGIPPWELGRAQQFIQDLISQDEIHGDVIDLGCGVGDNAIAIAEKGHMVWGIDLSNEAIEKAQMKMKGKDLNLSFILGNVLQAKVLGEKFNTVIDSGFFHLLPEKDKETYLDVLAHLTLKGSCLHLLTYSQKVKTEAGILGLKKSDIRQYFTKPFWKVLSINETFYETLIDDKGLHAWLAKIQRR